MIPGVWVRSVRVEGGMVASDGVAAVGSSEPVDDQDMAVSVHEQGDAVVVEVVGEVDLLTAPRLHDAVMTALASGPRVVVIDLLGVSFLGSSGLAVLVEAHQQAAGERTQLRVVAEGPATLRPLQVTALDRQLPLYPSRADALAG
jgi:anti-sigma B factor antagonist